MTRKKFTGALLEAIATFAGLGKELDSSNAKNFDGMKAGIFFEVDDDGSNEIGHYLLIELADGTKWRLLPERVLNMKPHESLLWGEFINGDSKDSSENSDESE